MSSSSAPQFSTGFYTCKGKIYHECTSLKTSFLIRYAVGKKIEYHKDILSDVSVLEKSFFKQKGAVKSFIGMLLHGFIDHVKTDYAKFVKNEQNSINQMYQKYAAYESLFLDNEYSLVFLYSVMVTLYHYNLSQSDRVFLMFDKAVHPKAFDFVFQMCKYIFGYMKTHKEYSYFDPLCRFLSKHVSVEVLGTGNNFDWLLQKANKEPVKAVKKPNKKSFSKDNKKGGKKAYPKHKKPKAPKKVKVSEKSSSAPVEVSGPSELTEPEEQRLDSYLASVEQERHDPQITDEMAAWLNEQYESDFEWANIDPGEEEVKLLEEPAVKVDSSK